MYQFNMSIDNTKAHWFHSTENAFGKRVRANGGIMAAKESDGRLNVSVACENENKQSLIKVIRDCIAEMFLTTVKLNYLRSALVLPSLGADAYNILLYTLVAFDRDTEKEIILGALNFGDNLALDGLFNFKLVELKKRWDDIAELAVNNSVYLSSDETLNELLKFLMSAISPKVAKLEIAKNKDFYRIRGKRGDGEFEYRVCSPEQLMIYLINIAPIELTLCGSFENDKIFNRLVSIFDIKSDNVARDVKSDFRPNLKI